MEVYLEQPFDDEIIVSQFEDVLQKAGLSLNEVGECPLYMTFYDGKAVAHNIPKLVMIYPTVEEVKASEQMMRELSCSDYSCPNHIDQYRIALRYGELKYEE